MAIWQSGRERKRPRESQQNKRPPYKARSGKEGHPASPGKQGNHHHHPIGGGNLHHYFPWAKGKKDFKHIGVVGSDIGIRSLILALNLRSSHIFCQSLCPSLHGDIYPVRLPRGHFVYARARYQELTSRHLQFPEIL